MVVIRLARAGAKNAAFFHVVVANKRSARDGRFIKPLGFFDPLAKGDTIRIRLDAEALDAWVKKGAQVSPRVARLVEECKAVGKFEITAENNDAKLAERAKVNAEKKKAAAAAAVPAEAAA